MTNKDNLNPEDLERVFADERGEQVPGSDAEFDGWVSRMAPAINAPGVTPREEMWRAIQAARSTAHDAAAGRMPGVVPIRRSPWRLRSLIAAALLLGIAINRVVLRRAVAPTSVPPVASSPADSADPARLYRLAATQTLTQAEALLTAYRASGDAQRNPMPARQLGAWGREVLGSTRLLIDSPAGSDPQLRTLLSDLELVLVQIIQISGAPLDPADRDLIDRALQDRDLLLRLRTAVPAGVTGSASAD